MGDLARNIIGAYQAGSQERQDEERRSAISAYLPGALRGDRAQATQLAASNPDMGLKVFEYLNGLEETERKRAMDASDRIALALVGPDGKPSQDPALYEHVRMLEKAYGTPEDKIAVITPENAQHMIFANQAVRQYRAQLEKDALAKRQAEASIRASESLANFRNGGGVRGMPGRPMSPGVQSKEDEDISDIQSVQSINTQIDNVLGQLEAGELDLGPVANLISGAQNLSGLSTPGSRNYAAFVSTLEKMRNDSLRLNKGVQTEGDAIRAWNEVTKYITDPKVVIEQLSRIRDLNALAARQRLQRINIRRERNGYQQFDPSDIGYGGGVQAQQPAQDDLSDVDALLGLK